MDLTPPVGADLFRREIRDLLERELSRDWRGEGALTAEERLDFRRTWRETLVRERLLAPHWPEAHGGRGLGPFEYSLVVEELIRAGVPLLPHENDGFGVSLLGPAVLRWGTDEQKHRLLPPTLAGTIRWAQGYSEPDAGSDLFAVRTRARREGDELVIDGQKVWQTAGLTANWIFALVRTNPSVAKSRGLSFVAVELDQPGILVRGIDNLNGHAEFCEVFFDGARTSVDNVIGDIDNGARVALTVLGHERGAAGLSLALSNRFELARLSTLARHTGTDDDAIRQRLGRLATRIEMQRAFAMKLLANTTKGEDIGVLSSIVKLRGTQHRQEVHELAVELLGAGVNDLHGGAGPEYLRPQPLGTDPLSSRTWVEDYLNARAGTIYGGSLQIQKNTIGEQLLGLPREPAVHSTKES